jgi:hypothetical protein
MTVVRALFTASLVLAMGVLALSVPGTATAFPGAGQDQDQVQTEDVIYHVDGRVFKGQILEETPERIVLEYHNRTVNIHTKMTFKREEIARIEKDVPVAGAPVAGGQPTTPARPAAAGASKKGKKEADSLVDDRKTFGVHRAGVDEKAVPSVYVVPMKGQMGTDISLTVYEEMKDDILLHRPDVLIIVMETIDEEDRIYSRIEEFDKGQHSLDFLDMYQDLVRFFHEDLGDIKQALWIHDSVGVSSVVAFSWEHIFMKPEARLSGARAAAVHFEAVKSDADMYGKFREAYMALLKGFVEYGHSNALNVMDAMVRPEYKLSASWKGREVEWRLDDKGETVVDNDDKEPANFVAKTAEDFMICEGLAETLDDIALLVGKREYRVIDGKGDDIFNKHKEDWRRAAENCVEWIRDYQQFMGWAGGEDTLKFLGQAKGRLEKVVAAIDRFDAVEFRMLQMGVSRFALVTTIELLKEQIRALREGQRGGGGGGGRGGGMGGGG